jgi:lipopolysaccharide transport system permease protein
MFNLTLSDLRIACNFAIYNLKSRNEGTYLGMFWYVIEPAILYAIFLFLRFAVFSGQTGISAEYILLGVLVVHFFIRTTTLMSDSIVSNYNLLESRKMNPYVFVVSRFFQSCLIHIIEIFIAICYALLFLNSSLIGYLLFFPLLAIFTFGVGTILAITMTKVLDLTYAWKFISKILYFVTPVFYVREVSHVFFLLNPLTIFLELVRATNLTHILLFREVVIFSCIILGMMLLQYVLYKLTQKTIGERTT